MFEVVYVFLLGLYILGVLFLEFELIIIKLLLLVIDFFFCRVFGVWVGMVLKNELMFCLFWWSVFYDLMNLEFEGVNFGVFLVG